MLSCSQISSSVRTCGTCSASQTTSAAPARKMLQELRISPAVPVLVMLEILAPCTWGCQAESACNMVVCDAGTALRTPPWTSTATQHTSSAWATLLALGGCETREFTELMSTKLHFPEECEELEESQISASCAQVFSSERAKMKSGFNALICSAKSSPRKLKTHPSRRTPSMAPIWSMESRKMATVLPLEGFAWCSRR